MVAFAAVVSRLLEFALNSLLGGILGRYWLVIRLRQVACPLLRGCFAGVAELDVELVDEVVRRLGNVGAGAEHRLAPAANSAG